MSTKTVNLTVAERITALNMLMSFKGGQDELGFMLDDAKALSLSDELKKEIKLVENKDEKGNTQSLTWDMAATTGKDVDVVLHSSTIDFFTKAFKTREDAHDFTATLADLTLISLNKKLI